MRRRLLMVALLGGSLGCRGIKGPIGEKRDVAPQHGGTLQMATYSDIRNLDPALAFDTTAQAIEQLLFARLVDYDRDAHLVPMLAERFDASADGRRYSFKLHEGVLFHDGDELTADDVKRSIERALDPDTPCPAPGNKVQACDEVASVSRARLLLHFRGSHTDHHGNVQQHHRGGLLQ